MKKMEIDFEIEDKDYSKELEFLSNHPLIVSFLKDNNLDEESLRYDVAKLYNVYSKYPDCKSEEEIEKIIGETKEFLPYLSLDYRNNVVVEYKETNKSIENRRLSEINDKYLYSDMPKEYKRYSIINAQGINIDRKSALIMGELDQWIADKNQYLFLYGPSNSGKSMYASAIANDLIEKGLKGLYLDVIMFTSEYFENSDQHNYVLNLIRDADVLVLDGLGVERVTHEWLDLLLVLLNYRQYDNQYTVLTSSYDLDVLKNHYSRTTYKESTSEKAEMIIGRIEKLYKKISLKGGN